MKNDADNSAVAESHRQINTSDRAMGWGDFFNDIGLMIQDFLGSR
jgi:hypothetical protein